MLRFGTPEGHEFAQVVRRLIDDHFRPHEDRIDRDDLATTEELRGFRRRSAAIGAVGFNLPEKIGGAGLSFADQVLVGIESGRVTTVLSEHIGYLPDSLQFASPAQISSLVEPLVSGDAALAYALTEPSGGSDLGSISTGASRTGSGWQISGTKQFITNAAHADFVLVLAVTAPSAPLAERFTVFVVQRDDVGFEVTERYRTMGWRGHQLNGLRLDSCVVGEDRVLGQVGRGFEVIMATINGGRLNVAARCLGAADRALQTAVDFASDRMVAGRRLTEHGMTQQKLADMDVDLRAAMLLVAEAAQCGDEGTLDFRTAVSRAKLFATEMAGRVADQAIQVLGAAGYTTDYPLERIARDVRGYRIGEGTSEIQRIQIARALVKSRS